MLLGPFSPALRLDERLDGREAKCTYLRASLSSVTPALFTYTKVSIRLVRVVRDRSLRSEAAPEYRGDRMTRPRMPQRFL